MADWVVRKMRLYLWAFKEINKTRTKNEVDIQDKNKYKIKRQMQTEKKYIATDITRS